MNYQLIILVKDMEVARGAVALLESGGVLTLPLNMSFF